MNQQGAGHSRTIEKAKRQRDKRAHTAEARRLTNYHKLIKVGNVHRRDRNNRQWLTRLALPPRGLLCPLPSYTAQACITLICSSTHRYVFVAQ